MELEIIIAPDGSVAIAVDNQDNLTFEEASQKIKKFQEAADLAGVPIQWSGEIERHSHGPDGQHVHRHEHA